MSADTTPPAGDLAHHRADAVLPLLPGAIGDVLRDIAARFGDRRAVVWDADGELQGLTYEALLAEAEAIARWLLGQAAPGERVAIWSRNSLEWLLLEYGCALAGMVVTAWNTPWSDFECQHARDLTGPALLFAGFDTRGADLFPRAERLGRPGRVFRLEQLRGLAARAPARALPKIGAADLFLIQFTSGTTGRPKGAMLSHQAALNSSWIRACNYGADETDVWLNPVPMTHVGGAVSMLLSALTTGGCYVLMNRFDAGEYLRLMLATGATRIGGVPTMMIGVLEHPDWKPGLAKVRSIGCGGSQVPRSLIERLMAEFGAPVLNVFAQSECPMITTTLPGDSVEVLADTVGRPASHVELKICDPQGRTLRRGEIGEICVRAPFVTDGYFRAPEATAAAFHEGGFLRTGDLGSLDADGYLRVQGRAREVIIRGGENIYPAEVEDALLQHPDVSGAAVVGVPDERWGQQVAAAIIPRAGCRPTAEALEAHAATRLAHFKIPRRWLLVEALPLTASGKVRKVDVEAMFAAVPA